MSRLASPLTRALLQYATWLTRYHSHRVLHLDRLAEPLARNRPVMIVGNHSFNVTDPSMLSLAILQRFGRIPRFLGHADIFYRFPGLSTFSNYYGVISSRDRGAALDALRSDGLLVIYPGSGREALRRAYTEKPYRLEWEDRRGFLQLALEADAELFFVAAVGIEQMYYQTRFELPAWLLRAFAAERYSGARWTIGLVGPGASPTVLPMPVEITHVVSEPLQLGDRAMALRQPSAMRELHTSIWGRCQKLLDDAVQECRRDAGTLDRAIRGGYALLRRSGL
jgi:1-acyl-sn-glycerol-3-phosphate acyltransferase